jgi:nucleoside-diphosphate-sugar epimerase
MMTAMYGEKVLVTGPAGQIASGICAHLARDNEVWGIARFSESAGRDVVERMGVRTVALDLADGDLAGVPTDFTYVLHLAAFQGSGLDYDYALAINAEATGLVLDHCRSAKAALVMSTASVYRPQADPWHAYVETDPLGDAHLLAAPTYSVSKIAQEAVARTMARLLSLPVTIARMNAAYGPRGGLPAHHLDAVRAGKPIAVRNDPAPYTPIHQNDINAQLDALLDAATVQATIVNWGGDEIVTVQQWCRYLGELAGREPDLTVTAVPGSQLGSILDSTKRRGITGPCQVSWQDGMRDLVENRPPH